MKGKLRKLLIVLLALVLAFSLFKVVEQAVSYRQARNKQQVAQDLAFTHTIPQREPVFTLKPEYIEPLPQEAQLLRELDLSSLQEINADVLGWFYIPGTDISYPLMEVETRDEYLRRAWDGSYSRAGSIFLERRSSRDFSDFNTIIYGHHMRDKSMFGMLPEYVKESYRDEHPCVYIATADTIRRYEVFAAYEAPVTSDTYRLVFENEERKQACLQQYLENSVWEPTQMPTIDDYILTLSTCTGTGTYHSRWVVQAVLTGQWSR